MSTTETSPPDHAGVAGSGGASKEAEGPDTADTADTADAPDASRPRRARRLLRPLRWIGSLIGVVLILSLLAVGFVLGTQTGLRTLMAVSDDLAPGLIQASRVEGRILGRLELDDLALRLPGLEVSIGTLRLDWRPGALFTGTLHVRELRASDMAVVTEPSADETPAEPFELPSIKLPIAVRIEQALIERLSYREAGAPPETAIELTRAELSATANGDLVELERLQAELSQPVARVRMDGQVRLDEAYPIELALDWHFEQAPALSLTGEGKVTGDLEQARLTGTLNGTAPAVAEMSRITADLDVEWAARVLTIKTLRLTESSGKDVASAAGAPEGARIKVTGQLDTNPTVPTFSVQALWEHLRWPLAGVPMAQSPQGSLSAEGALDGYTYSLDAQAHGPQIPETELALAGTGDQQHTEILELKLNTLDGLIRGQGRLDWSPELTWELALTASNIDPGRHYAGLDGRIRLTAETVGGLEKGFDFRLNADAALADYPPTRVDLAGTGTASAATIETLAIEVIGGRIAGTGALSWAPKLRWDADLSLAELDPGQLLADWPGTLGGRLQSQGELAEDGLDLSARLSDFGGTLRGYPVTVQADLGMQGETLSIRTLEAVSGETRFAADGQLGERIDLRYTLNSPNLAALLPDLQGRLEAEGGLAGTLEQPRATLALAGRGIEMNDQGVERIDATADVGLDQESPFQLAIDGRDLILGSQRFERLQVRGQGSTGSHQLSAEIDGEPLRLSLALDGNLDATNAYRGRLTRLALETGEYDDWDLGRAAPFSLAAGALEVGPLCVGNSGSSSGCVTFRQPEAGRFSASLDLQRLDFDLLDALTTETTAINGYLTAQADVEGQGDLLTGSAELRVPEGGVEIVLPRVSETLVFTGTRLDVRAGASGVDARFALPIAEVGQVDAELGLPGFRLSGLENQALKGRLRIALDGLDRFATLAPEVSGTEGTINGEIELGGRLLQPRMGGHLAARDIAFSVASIGLRVKDLNLTAASEGREAMRLDGGAWVGGGQLNVDGTATGLGGGEPNIALSLKGQDLKVADSKEYMALVSLDLEAGFGPDGGTVRGELSVPEATIMPRSLPAGAVQPSPDVVLDEDADNAGLPLSIDVLAKLGDAVLIEAFGLRGLLQGQLRVTQQPDRALVGSGELQVIDGTYRVSLPGLGLLTSVGPPLVIKKGIVLFASTPLDNPGIILNAQREGGDMSAGVQVLGTLRNPKLAFFSESDPNLSQSEITRYLVTGIPPRRNGETDDRSLSVGTYIAPKLYMEYDSSLGDTSDRIKMRYDLTNRIQLQSETGDGQGVDLFYKFEH
ncbi:translocation/assembly module TamB domain-containing protein [Halochromatium salexigens]|uniref:Translocation and assembly module TamB C-terminal domain-containing protein n=1 Tax=Halochromatium salexigens TaxID=49447 RepID=A0AAJ0XH87_HALSE|nr:hypothetical protein [Halochromatium salexigens]